MEMDSVTREWWQDPETVKSLRYYAHMCGLLYHSRNLSQDGYVNLPLTLQPWRFPKELYELVWEIQPQLNSLIDAVSRDTEFLKESLKGVIRTDEYVARLFQLFLESQSTPTSQVKTTIGIHRSDYLLDYRKGGDEHGNQCLGIKQVEVNTLSCAFGGVSQGPIQDFHQYVHTRYFAQTKPLDLPEPSRCLADALATAWKHYGNPDAYLLFVVIEQERNFHDQRMLDFDLWKRHGVKVMWRTLEELSEVARLGSNQELLVSGLEVAVVYYRSGYSPDHYTEQGWSARLLMERSRAASCPPMAYQLVGIKKMQQILTAPGVLERFIQDPEQVQKIRSTFTGLYSLDKNAEGDRNLVAALERPQDFVLKPQREAGGNNFFGDEVRSALEKNSEAREGYILMDKICSPSQRGLFLDSIADTVQQHSMVCELGIFGAYVRHGDTVLMNTAAGSLARSKAASSNEGGILAQGAALDCVHLIPTPQFLTLVDKEE